LIIIHECYHLEARVMKKSKLSCVSQYITIYSKYSIL